MVTPSQIIGHKMELLADFLATSFQYKGELPPQESKRFPPEQRVVIAEILKRLREHGYFAVSADRANGITWGVNSKSKTHLLLEEKVGREIPVVEKSKHVGEFEESLNVVCSAVVKMNVAGVLTEDEAGQSLSVINDCLFKGDMSSLEEEKEKLRGIYRSNAKSISEADILKVFEKD